VALSVSAVGIGLSVRWSVELLLLGLVASHYGISYGGTIRSLGYCICISNSAIVGLDAECLLFVDYARFVGQCGDMFNTVG
jgi:hypothetical protein